MKITSIKVYKHVNVKLILEKHTKCNFHKYMKIYSFIGLMIVVLAGLRLFTISFCWDYEMHQVKYNLHHRASLDLNVARALGIQY